MQCRPRTIYFTKPRAVCPEPSRIRESQQRTSGTKPQAKRGGPHMLATLPGNSTLPGNLQNQTPSHTGMENNGKKWNEFMSFKCFNIFQSHILRHLRHTWCISFLDVDTVACRRRKPHAVRNKLRRFALAKFGQPGLTVLPMGHRYPYI